MNKLFNSAVGTQQDSFLPNQRYLFLAMILYTPSLRKAGSTMNADKIRQGPLSFPATRSAAVEPV